MTGRSSTTGAADVPELAGTHISHGTRGPMRTQDPVAVAHMTALVALRSPGEGKTRMSAELSPDERAHVARAMARDVTQALRDAGTSEVLVVARGAGAVQFATSLGMAVVPDRSPCADLSAAFADALRMVSVTRAVLLVCADLPGLQAADIDRVLAAPAEVVVAPTRDGGTGGLLLRPGARIGLAYGRGSASAHHKRALAAGLTATTVVTAGFNADVDDPDDLRRSAATWPATHTGRLVRRWTHSAAKAVMP